MINTHPVTAEFNTPMLVKGSDLIQIVVADDDAMQRQFTSAIVRRMGYDPIEVVDGDAALNAIVKTRARILICDINMPGLDGMALTRQIRKMKLLHYIHIVMVTGRDGTDDRRLALEAGVDDFMTKPFDASMMKVRIRAAARLIAHEDALSDQYRILEVAKDRIESDLRAAAQAQRRLLPLGDGNVLTCRFHSAFVPSTIVSGDMFSYFPLDRNRIGFYAVDVAGHGIHAALLSVAIGHLVTSDYFLLHSFDANGKPDPAAMVRGLNERFVRDGCDEYFTMFCGILDQSTDCLTFCQAGYPSPFLVSRTGECEMIGAGGYPVGLFGELDYENGLATLTIGDLLFLYSDGGVEAESLGKEPFGEDRLKAILLQSAVEGADHIPETVIAALSDWRSGVALDDDLTILVLERGNLS